MIVVRPIAKGDFDQYRQLAYHSHINFYTLPKNDTLLTHLYEKALRSFATDVRTPGPEFYIFVAEDTETKELLGVSALSAISGGNEPLFFFKQRISRGQPILEAVSYPEGPSEVASLFVSPKARGTGVGKLLSLARFMFVARFPERFTDSFIAELRGSLQDETSLFWENVGRKFFDEPFTKVQEMICYGRSFIQGFLPEYPIYVHLLPQAVQDVIGKVDHDTEAAYSLLSRLGFVLTDEVDVIDAGPKVAAKTCDISIVKNSYVTEAKSLAKAAIISNDKIDFRAILATEVSLDALTIGPNESIRVYEL
ncbi:MAG: arginine N-succinyltransferase [Verrucomicrobia bacterium]|nr:arginine N-succinyltransferase [Verrucomicrobiota bacterium]MBS0636821.1 arginine N-succinyltransferase [Verrucomicrobiota bacterium]